MENKIAIFKDAETILEVPVSTEEKTVWLNRQQMSVLFVKILSYNPAM